MKIKTTFTDPNGGHRVEAPERDVHHDHNFFDGTTCAPTAGGGVIITICDEDELGNDAITTVELDKEEIALINRVKL